MKLKKTRRCPEKYSRINTGITFIVNEKMELSKLWINFNDKEVVHYVKNKAKKALLIENNKITLTDNMLLKSAKLIKQ